MRSVGPTFSKGAVCGEFVRSLRLQLLIESSAARRTRWCGAGAWIATTERTEQPSLLRGARSACLQPTPDGRQRVVLAAHSHKRTLGTFGLGRDWGHVTPADYFTRSARVPTCDLYFCSHSLWTVGISCTAQIFPLSLYIGMLFSKENIIVLFQGKTFL